MALRAGAGRAARWFGRGVKGDFEAIGRGTRSVAKRAYGSPIVAGGILGGAAVAGGISGVLDEEGPYAQIQEDWLGDRNAIRASLRAGIGSAINPDDNVYGRGDYYYGQRVNPRSPHTQPVSGDVVLGMYNLRR